MNTSQNIFALFFAISWGIASNVLWRWKPFPWALLFKYRQPTVRAVFSFIFLNVFPWLLFAVVLWILRGKEFVNEEDWSFSSCARLIPRAIVPGLIPFGCYRIWQAIIRRQLQWFYLSSPKAELMEPNLSEHDTSKVGVNTDLFVGVVYLALLFFALVPWK